MLKTKVPLKGMSMPKTKVPSKGMSMPEIRMKAKALGLKTVGVKKVDLIQAIQLAEGCTPCFGKSNGHCKFVDCCFMADCFQTKL